MRKTYEELNELKKELNVDILWSFSRFNCYRTSQYEYMLKYIRRVKEDNDKVSPYGVLGNCVHDALENLYEGKLKREDLEATFDDDFTVNIDIAGLKFDRTDSSKHENIKMKYYDNLKYFCKNYKVLPYKKQNEQFMTIRLADNIVFQGYADAIWKDDGGNYVIEDYKTSSLYQGKKKVKESAQLLLYAEALRQLGVPQDKIKCCWNFLKYNLVKCQQVNGKIKERYIERRELGAKLKASAKMWMKKLGYEDQIEDAIFGLVNMNDIAVLPKEVQEKFEVCDCYVYVDDIWKNFENLKEEIIETIGEIESKTEQFNQLKDTDMNAAEHLFWDSEESLKAQSYYYNNLCGYRVATMKPYKQYLDSLDKAKNSDVFFNNSPVASYGVPVTNSEPELAEDDLSWLADL